MTQIGTILELVQIIALLFKKKDVFLLGGYLSPEKINGTL